MPTRPIRDDFPLLRRVTHLDSASRGPMSRNAIETMVTSLRGLHETNDRDLREECQNAKDRCRTLASRLLGCSNEEIGLVFNTTHGINAVASGIQWRRGESVVIPDVEYPANLLPWLRQRARGAKVRIAPTIGGELTIDCLKGLMDEKTRVIAVSHVEFGNGCRNDIAAISEAAHSVGALLFVDAAQSLGVVDTDVRKLGIDVLSSCSYKWLCGPSGTGIMYARSDLVPELRPFYIGFESISPQDFKTMYDGLDRDGWKAEPDYPLSPFANRFEFGEASDVVNLGFAHSMEYLLDHGIRGIEKRSTMLADYLISRLDDLDMEVLTPKHPSRRAGIVTFRPQAYTKGNRALATELAKRGVLVTPRYGGIRASCHFFNDEGDIDALVDQVHSLVG